MSKSEELLWKLTVLAAELEAIDVEITSLEEIDTLYTKIDKLEKVMDMKLTDRLQKDGKGIL